MYTNCKFAIFVFYTLWFSLSISFSLFFSVSLFFRSLTHIQRMEDYVLVIQLFWNIMLQTVQFLVILMSIQIPHFSNFWWLQQVHNALSLEIHFKLWNHLLTCCLITLLMITMMEFSNMIDHLFCSVMNHCSSLMMVIIWIQLSIFLHFFVVIELPHRSQISKPSS